MDLERAGAAFRRALDAVEETKRENAERLVVARREVERARAALAEVIVDEYLNRGAKVGDLARRSTYSRETVRVVLRAAGVDPE